MIYADPSKLSLLGYEQLKKLDAAIEPAFNEEGKLVSWKFVFTFKDFDQTKKSRDTIWGTITHGHTLLEWLTTREEETQSGIYFSIQTRKVAHLTST